MSTILIAALVVNGVLALAYRLLRNRRGGPIVDVYGGVGLFILLLSLAGSIGAGAEGLRWVAFGYAVLFGLVVAPIWVLAVVIPARPDKLEYTLVGSYWLTLPAIAISAIAI